jgi:Phage QLRG family, putative DNA packaging.
MAALTQLQKLKLWLDMPDSDTDHDQKLQLMLDRAESVIKHRRNWPEEEPMEPRWNELQIQIALFLWNKQGAEGETQHTENGVSRSYENSDIPASLLNDITPFVVVVT